MRAGAAAQETDSRTTTEACSGRTRQILRERCTLTAMAANPSEPRAPFSNVSPRASVDSLLRTAQQHHVQLSLMADTKASILITISSIVLTISLSRSGDPQLRPALLTLAAACLISLMLAIIAVLPTFAGPRANSRRRMTRNILFFGHFASMSEQEYLAAMERILSSDALIYETAVRDIHSLGVYLYRKKYRFLRFAYVALFGGFILATVVEAWFYWHS
jgi:hypothetical protein